MKKGTCEICHNEEATGTRWLNADDSPIHVAGIYRVGEKCGGPKYEDKSGIVPTGEY